MTVLPITLTIAAAAGLINLWIAGRASAARMPQKILIGDGGDTRLMGRMRAHANFIEYTPIFLILLALIELAEGSMTWLWAVAIVFILARILHVFGLDRGTANVMRVAGFMLSFAATLALAVYALTIPYRHRTAEPGITFAASAQPASTESPTKGFVRRS